jgi:DNA-binding MarR family transcriptional regulator
MNSNHAHEHVREVLQLLVRRFGLLQKDSAQCCGISVIQSHILYEVSRRGRLSLNELAEALGVDTSTLSRQVQQLVESGLLDRTPDANDRRYVILSLTDAGVRQTVAIAGQMEDYIQHLFIHIPQEKQEQVLESLGILNDAMSKSPNCCTPPL